MFSERVQALLDAMTWEERLDFDYEILSRFNGTEAADAWKAAKIAAKLARENDNNKGDK